MVAQTPCTPAGTCRRRARHALAELDTDVLALLLQAGDSGTNAVAQTGKLVAGPAALAGLARAAGLEDLAGLLGMDRTRAAALAAALELRRRLLLEPSEAHGAY